MCGGADNSSWHSWEKREVARLVTAYEQMVFAGGTTLLGTPAADEACAAFLKELERCAELLEATMASRNFRAAFTRNYQSLFQNGERQYRVDVLSACVNRCPDVHVNGAIFSFSDVVVGMANKLNASLGALCTSLGNCSPTSKWPTKWELLNLLEAVDRVWADFECEYIKKLINVEFRARLPLMMAAKHASDMLVLEEQQDYRQRPEYIKAQRSLWVRITEINVLANDARKGRGDLNDETLNVAYEVICQGANAKNGCELIVSLAQDLLDAFLQMRQYLCKVGRNMDRVDPSLRNNVGLVERLAHLEEAWEMVRDYVQDEAVRCTLESIYSELLAMRRFEPSFQLMCESCDVELFLALPRVLWLVFLRDSTKDAMMQKLIPHCFDKEHMCRGIHSLLDKFNVSRTCLVGADLPVRLDSSQDVKDVAWEFLVHQAVWGPSSHADDQLIRIDRTVRDFMRELEIWSMELQRCQPEKWNAFSAILVQGLSGDRCQDQHLSSSI